MSRHTFFAIALFFIIGSPLTALAAGPINIRTIPAFPGPETFTTVRVESFIVDIKGSRLIWLLNDAPVQDGIGATEYKFTTGGLGSESIFEVLISTPDGKNFKETLRIYPAAIDLLWEADTYTPPFYKGKALPTHRSSIKVMALPQFGSEKISTQTAHYQWTLNQSTGAGKGTGISSVSVEASPQGGAVSITAEVTSNDGLHKGARTMQIPSVSPEVVFYEDSPIYGIRWERALLGIVSTPDPEYRVHGTPFFFAKTDRDYGNLVYQWYVNNQPLRMSPGVNEDITVLRGDAPSAQHKVLLRAQNNKRPTQKGAQAFDIRFTETN